MSNSEIQIILSEIRKVHEGIGALETKVDSLDEKVGNLEDAVHVMDKRLTEVEGNVEKNGIKILSLEKRMIQSLKDIHVSWNGRLLFGVFCLSVIASTLISYSMIIHI
jgi:peptidoglycan hydrolase CwlO-like protein